MKKIRKHSKLLLAPALAMSIAACNTTPTEQKEESSHGIDLSLMDTTVAPGEDFYRFVNGKWLDQTEIPADQGRWSSFNELREKTEETVLSVLEKAGESGAYKEGSDQWKAAEFYRVGMDSLLAENVGVKPLQPVFTKIDEIDSKEELLQAMAELKPSISPFFSFYVYTDRKNSEVVKMHVSQGGLGLPDRDYYTKTDQKSKDLRAKYEVLVGDMLVFTGMEKAAAQKAAANIMELETSLAEASMTNVERRNPENTYNLFAISELDAHTPNFAWSAYFSALGVSGEDSVIVGQPEFLKTFDSIVASGDVATWKAYLKWNVIRSFASELNHEINQRSFDFYGKELRGTDQMRDRWKRVLATTNGALGEAIGKLYVEKAFPPAAKETAKEMIDYLKKSFENRINNLEWMSDSTKMMAQKKLSSFSVKIGYPDEWKTYEDVEVSDASYVENVMSANTAGFQRNLDKLGKPVDKKEWFMTPQTVNAYYSPTNNEIVFPAAIMQPPFYDYKADMAVNFGGIGAVIGHEISHGFDDNGSRYDGEGNLKNWWGTEDLEAFESRTDQLGAQYDSYEPLDSVHVNGDFTMGENIGDLGGVLAAYDGLQLYLKDNGRPDDIQGFTPEQRFFISWSTIWRTKYRDEALRNQIMTDPHSPGMYRAVGPLVNVDAFYKAFNITEVDPLFKPSEERVRIW